VDESESPAFEDSKLTVPDPFPPAEGFVLISPDGSYALDLGVRGLAHAVGVLPREWSVIDVRVERRGLRRVVIIEVTTRDGRLVDRWMKRPQAASDGDAESRVAHGARLHRVATTKISLRAERGG
jgi:hypothetical protein